MDDRAERARKIAALQKEIGKLHEAGQARLQREIAALEAERDRIFEAFDGEPGLQSLFLGQLSRRLGALEARKAQAQGEREAAGAARLQARLRESAAESLAAACASAARDARERAALEEWRPASAPRKPGAA